MTRTLFLVGAVTAAVSLAGCMGAPAEGFGPVPINPTSRFSLQVEPGLDRVALAVHEEGLSQNQTLALRDMVNRFAVEGAPMLTVEAPSGDDPVSSAAAWAVKGALEAQGVPPSQVRVVTYFAPDPRAPVLVGFETVRAVVPQCGQSWTNLTRTGNNAGSANFGCAVNANLAAQIANPRDIVTPRAMTPSDAARRSVVFDHYRAGEQTAAVRETLVDRGRVSNAVD
ncbi:CpaD family pilus assembly protein [Brevundimonas sp. NIBR11]|uniref:CpaD family pilus assembly protein n=1 Tax=Brevundimonas sp. NIBR11 TaxID=3015999 RepID=UPI0022F132BA|nr:CpaD family pilus assembly protein [Brevundimonas sp. NIBR11]